MLVVCFYDERMGLHGSFVVVHPEGIVDMRYVNALFVARSYRELVLGDVKTLDVDLLPKIVVSCFTTVLAFMM